MPGPASWLLRGLIPLDSALMPIRRWPPRLALAASSRAPLVAPAGRPAPATVAAATDPAASWRNLRRSYVAMIPPPSPPAIRRASDPSDPPEELCTARPLLNGATPLLNRASPTELSVPYYEVR